MSVFTDESEQGTSQFLICYFLSVFFCLFVYLCVSGGSPPCGGGVPCPFWDHLHVCAGLMSINLCPASFLLQSTAVQVRGPGGRKKETSVDTHDQQLIPVNILSYKMNILTWSDPSLGTAFIAAPPHSVRKWQTRLQLLNLYLLGWIRLFCSSSFLQFGSNWTKSQGPILCFLKQALVTCM